MGRVSRDLGAGLCLLGISLLAIWQGSELELGTLRQMGPGMMPRVLAVLLGVCGVALSVRSLTERSAQPSALPVAALVAGGAARWAPLRGPVCLLAAAGAFGLTVRPLGLVVAAPLGILLSMGAHVDASRGQRRWLLESLAFALGLTLFCVLLFRTLLSLPMPVAPWLIGY